MPSLDFDVEKALFRDYYEESRPLLDNAIDSFSVLITSLINHAGAGAISKIEGRVKDKEECIKKFTRKYRTALEMKSEPYTIKDHLTDMLGLRLVCLYEDDIEKIRSVLSEQFDVVDVTDKISQIENTEGSFGYKGLHLDLRLNAGRRVLPEYARYADLCFELQIRTVIQDSWSILDHKIKYKKSIPNRLKRRINTLAALFELADREFREIRDSTVAEIEKEDISYEELSRESEAQVPHQELGSFRYARLNAFSFLKIAKHFFSGYEFEPHKVDGFTDEILGLSPGISRGKFNFYMRENITSVKRYQTEFEQNSSDTLNPFTIIRHCLYAGDKELFANILTNAAQESFEKWLRKGAGNKAEQQVGRNSEAYSAARDVIASLDSAATMSDVSR
ncbi:MAG: (p)ppGpp synthetase [Tardiphaga sp.]|uniref:GTP pyrophosphokinase n=1 Tax=Tardiphaga sp. TaxID=1926292 RepID=UPI0026364253|nr:(p)ppGpp synthetase [Tardiphaga sp.]MDB5503476.1 (p)ppGpp synthetase [Tardiphaga sp.]